jgi:type 1 fimbria pilin
MKKMIGVMIALACLQANVAKADNGGRIDFSGQIAKSPCAIPAATLVAYASQPRLYQAARQQASGPSCSGMDNTQSLTLSKVQGAATGNGIVNIVYN